VLGHFSRVFDVRTTFFDMDGHELEGLDVKALSGFCRRQRREPAFAARCVACDREHIGEARRSGDSLVYRCHRGLIEAVVPLRDEAGGFLGALVQHVSEHIIRSQLARRRLRAGATVREVAGELGFYDAFHFSRRFKARFGCSPTRYASGATSRP
jgi:hypothetical protein